MMGAANSTDFSALWARGLILADEAAPAGWGARAAELVRNPVACGVVLAGIALWLMLPRGAAKGRLLGAVLGVVALGCLATQLLPLAPWSASAVFWILGGITVVSATCTVTFRSPVYCAVWFALTLTGTAGIFLLQGAQFLGVATIVVYAGAILVTFLFVLMLAQPRGNAYYDRVSWEAVLAAGTGAALVGILSLTIGKLSLDQSAAPKPEALSADVLTSEHVSRLGAELFGRHLIAVEVAGTLLLVALVGATAIVAHSGKLHKPTDEHPGLVRSSGTERDEHVFAQGHEEAVR